LYFYLAGFELITDAMTNKDLTTEIEQLHVLVKKLLEEKHSNEEIVEQLQKQGLEPYYIETIIQNIHDEESDKKSFRSSMIMGLFYVVAGLSINVFSFMTAENTGSSIFYLFWGIVVFGIVTIIRGFILYKR
jgi:hypothetical protein